MKFKKIIMAVAVISVLICSVSAVNISQEQACAFGMNTVDDALSDEAAALMKDADPYESESFFVNILSIFRNALLYGFDTLKNAGAVFVRLMLIVVLCQLADAGVEDHGRNIVAAAGALAVFGVCISDFRTMVGFGTSAMQSITDFSSLLLPVVVSAATASGAVTGAGVLYGVSSFFSDLTVRLINGVLLPAVYAYLALALADAAAQKEHLKKLRELIGWAIEKGLKLVMYIFTGFLSVTGVLSGAADAAVLKGAKFAISGSVPVVGGIISDAASTVLSGAALLKSSAGTFGMLGIFAIFIAPFLNMGASYLLMKISAAIGGTFGSSQSSLLEAVSSAMGYLLAMTASCALIAMLSCCFLVKTVQL